MPSGETVRMSVDVPKELHELIKSAASFEHKTLRDFVIEAVKSRLEVSIPTQKRELAAQYRKLNELTRKTLAKTDRGEDLYEYESIDAFFAEMMADEGRAQ